MENKKAKRAPCKRVCENLNSLESTSGLVQQHASGSCSPKILRLSEYETCTAVQLPPDNSSSSSHNNGGEESIKRRRRDRERLKRLNETEEQRSIQLNNQRILDRRRLQSESPQTKAICLERIR